MSSESKHIILKWPPIKNSSVWQGFAHFFIEEAQIFEKSPRKP